MVFLIQGLSLILLTIIVQNGYAAYRIFDKQVNDVHDGGIHTGRLETFQCWAVDFAKSFPKHLRLLDVDSNEFENTILCDNRYDHAAIGLIIDIDKRDTAGTRLQHTATGSVERLHRVGGYCLQGLYTNGLFNVTERAQPELVDGA